MAKKAYIGVDGVARKIKKGYVGVPAEIPIYDTTTTSVTVSNIEEFFGVVNSSYYFKGSGGTFVNTNGGVANSTAKTTLTAKVDMDVSFYYSYASEANYDKFTLQFGSTTVENAVSGASTTKSYSGSLKAGESIVFTYAKDGSQDSNGDRCAFSTIKVTAATVVGTRTEEVARKIKKAYIGIGGVARPFWSGGELAYYGTITGLSVGRYRLAGASNPNYAIFAGGIQSTTYQSTVDAYDKSYTRQTATALAVARQYPAGGSIGNYAIIAGGETSDSGTVVPHTNVEAYDLSLTKHTPSALSVARGVIAFASVGDYAIFAGGQHANSPYYTNVVNAYNSSLTRTDKRLSGSRREAAGASIGSYALIAGGTGVYNGGGGSPIPSVEAFDASLTITSAPILKSSAYGLSGTRAGAYAVFGGGYGSAVTSNVTAYNASLTKSTPTVLSKARMRMAAAALGSNGIFGGGGTSTISGLVATVDVYDENLTRTTPNELSSSRADLAAANIGDSALFAGGKNNKTNVDVFTIV